MYLCVSCAMVESGGEKLLGEAVLAVQDPEKKRRKEMGFTRRTCPFLDPLFLFLPGTRFRSRSWRVE